MPLELGDDHDWPRLGERCGFQDQNAKDTGVTTQETSQAKFNRLFARKLATAAKEKGIHVWLYDESYTSMEAKEYMLATGSNRRTRRTEVRAW
jgi:RNase H-fold protein (predicted Holliday junction resolvase)